MDPKLDSIKDIIEMGEGTRVEIDFIDVLNDNEGVLVGDTAKGFIRVLAETRKTETYPPRPFRVNAGAIHQYIYIGNNRTKYLSELCPGDAVPVSDGNTERMVTIGRLKIEKRDFARIETLEGISATLQKADSVFIAGELTPFHLLDVKEGDTLQVFPSDLHARHKGEAIQESIVEK